MSTFTERLTFYKEKFLPFLENYLYMNFMHGCYLTHKEGIAKYFELNRGTVDSLFQRAIDDGFITFQGRSTKMKDRYTEHSMCVYLPTPDTLFDTKLRRYVLLNTKLELTPQNRINRFRAYIKKVRVKTEDVIEKEQAAHTFASENEYFTMLLRAINADRQPFFRSSYLEEGKLRENNVVCTTLNPHKEHNRILPVGALEYRGILLTDFFKNPKHEEHDANGNIYRLTYALTHKEPLSHEEDIYSQMWEKAKFSKILVPQVRDFIKSLCMPIYMSNGLKNGYNSMLLPKDSVKLEDAKKSEAIKNVASYLELEPTTKNGRLIMDKLTDGMHEFLGTDKFFEEKIFIYESNLHILMLTDFKKQGINSLNIYDGFNFIEGTCSEEKFNEVYDRCTEEILRRTNLAA